jgi:tripartite-type tricarboxylate transporter receptor subunit TctC
MMTVRTLGAAFVVAGVGVTLLVAGASAQAWPQRPVRLMLPVPAGGGSDVTARLFADQLSKRWGQPVIVENRPGGDGIVGVSAFIGARDDHALLFSISAVVTVHPAINDKLPYDPVRDLVPIAPASDILLAIAASNRSGIRSLGELETLARAHPGKLNWASSPGLPPFVVGGFFKKSRLDIVSVPYKDLAPALEDLSEGRLDIYVHALSVLAPQAEASRARLLAIANRERGPAAAQIPTVVEVGYPDLSMDGLTGFYGRRGLSDTLRDRIAADIHTVAETPGIRERLVGLGQAARTDTPAQFAALLADYRLRIATLAKILAGNSPY